MSESSPTLPIVRPLPPDLAPEQVFRRLSRRPHCLWLDSSSGDLGISGRYSFLSADPIRWLSVPPGGADPWPTLARWIRELPESRVPGLPPFQGGLAGVIGYEAATWLEPVPTARYNDLPVAAMAIGLYDWTVAFDHAEGRAWLISQGLQTRDPAGRRSAARCRVDQVEAWLWGDDATDPRGANETPVTSRLHSPHEATPPLFSGASEPASLSPQYPTPRRGVTSNFTSEGFREAVAEIVRRIRAGDSFQVNLAQRLLRPATSSSPSLYLRLRRCNPAPFAGFLDAGDFQLLSSSPEGFLNVRDRQVETRPIKGTVPRTGDPNRDAALARTLEASEKDRAENVMIVDLMRNDLSRVCTDESVRVTQLCEIERYQHVQHLVSAVRGQLREEADTQALLRACFPGGSVTGAPKIEAMRTIAELEPNGRGPYCGSLGYLSCGGDAEFNILIRSVTATAGYWQIPVGGGITARSDPAAEEAETWTKAGGMLEATDPVPQIEPPAHRDPAAQPRR